MDLYVIITGFFLINSQYNLNKLIKLIEQVFFYSVVIYLILYVTGFLNIEIETLIKSFIPTTSKQYWFITAYVALYFLHPFINKMLKSINKKQYLFFILVMLFMWSFMPTFVWGYDFFGSEIPQLIMLYSIGAFLRLHSLNYKIEKKVGLIFIAGSSFVSIIFWIIMNLLTNKIELFRKISINYIDRNSLFVIVLSIGIFLIFKNLNLGSNKFINSVAKCSLGVYLIHMNPYLYTIIWTEWLPNGKYANSPKVFVHMIISVLIVYTICTLIELLRIILIEKPILKMFNKPINKLQLKLEKLYDEFFKKLERKAKIE